MEERSRLESCQDYYLHTKLLIEALYWQHNYLIPNRVQVLIYDFAFVQRLPVQLKFYIRVTRAFKGKREHGRILNTHIEIEHLSQVKTLPTVPGLEASHGTHRDQCCSVDRWEAPYRCHGEEEMLQFKGK